MSHTVIVPGILKKNGQLAHYGEEVNKDSILNIETREEEGYIQKTSEFKKARKAEEDAAHEAGLSDEDKAKAKLEADNLTKKIEKHNSLLDKYKSQFEIDAPEDASDEDIAAAIKDKKQIGGK